MCDSCHDLPGNISYQSEYRLYTSPFFFLNPIPGPVIITSLFFSSIVTTEFVFKTLRIFNLRAPSYRIKKLLTEYNAKEEKTFEDILDFHVKFERIHPFQDGNGRVGRLIMFKECLKYNIVPFIIEDNLKMFLLSRFERME